MTLLLLSFTLQALLPFLYNTFLIMILLRLMLEPQFSYSIICERDFFHSKNTC